MSADIKLFAVLVGGKHARASIELHDVQFVVARSIEETWPALRAGWWGVPSSLHIDGWVEVEAVDGYAVRPVPASEAKSGGPSLYFVNTGGYEDGVFGEMHAYSFHVGDDKKAIWSAAKERAPFGQQHMDNFDMIDDVVCVDDVLASQRYALALEKRAGADAARVMAKYMKQPAA